MVKTCKHLLHLLPLPNKFSLPIFFIMVKRIFPELKCFRNTSIL